MNKSILIGALTGNAEGEEKLLDMIADEYSEQILERIYYRQLHGAALPQSAFALISNEEYIAHKEAHGKYLKFQEMQKGKASLPVSLGQISQMKSEGMSNREIAARLGVSEGTIRNRLKKGNSSPFIICLKPSP